jgi:hypothetical protein
MVIQMTQDQYESEILSLTRRLRLLRDVQRGDIRLKKILVTRSKKSWIVHARTKSYYRYIAPIGWK